MDRQIDRWIDNNIHRQIDRKEIKKERKNDNEQDLRKLMDIDKKIKQQERRRKRREEEVGLLINYEKHAIKRIKKIKNFNRQKKIENTRLVVGACIGFELCSKFFFWFLF